MTDGSETDAGPDPEPRRTAPLLPKPRIPTLRILVDADACPAKEEIYKVAYRRNVPVVLVRNARFRMPDHPLMTDHPLITGAIVSDSFDAADDWFAQAAGAGTRSIVVTVDILLADRCLEPVLVS